MASSVWKTGLNGGEWRRQGVTRISEIVVAYAKVAPQKLDTNSRGTSSLASAVRPPRKSTTIPSGYSHTKAAAGVSNSPTT